MKTVQKNTTADNGIDSPSNDLKILYIRVPVVNVDSALNWYVEKLGAVKPHKAHDGLASCSLAGGPAIHLIRIDDEKRLVWVENGKQEPVIGLLSGSIHRLRDDLDQRGVTVDEMRDEGSIGWFFNFYDLHGNLYEVYGPKTEEQYRRDLSHGNNQV